MAAYDSSFEDTTYAVIVRSSIPGKPQIWDWVLYLSDDELAGRYNYDLTDDAGLPFRYRFVFSDLDTATMFRMRF